MKDNRQRRLEEGWILMGEIEFRRGSNGGTLLIDESSPTYLYTKYDEGRYYYHIGSGGLQRIGIFDTITFDKYIPIVTFLTLYISMDRDYGVLSGGGHLVQKAQDWAIKLRGMRDWIEVDDDFLHNRIDLDDLIKKSVSEPKYVYIK